MRPCAPQYLQSLALQSCHDPATLLTTVITAGISAGGSLLGQRSADKKQKKSIQDQENAIREREAAANAAQRDQLRAGRNARGGGDFNALGAVLGSGEASAAFAPLRRLTGAN